MKPLEKCPFRTDKNNTRKSLFNLGSKNGGLGLQKSKILSKRPIILVHEPESQFFWTARISEDESFWKDRGLSELFSAKAKEYELFHILAGLIKSSKKVSLLTIFELSKNPSGYAHYNL